MPLASLEIGIIGLGQMGGSIAARLRSVHPLLKLHGFDIKREMLSAAAGIGLITSQHDSAGSLIADTDVVIIALPISIILDVMTEHAESLRKKRLVTDTGSLKTEIAQQASRLGMQNFIGGHPLAGTEKRGIDSWSKDMFIGANYFLVKNEDTKSESSALMSELVRAMGAREVAVESEEHDLIFATTSNLPHIFSFALMRLYQSARSSVTQKSLFECPSFRSATRIANSDPEMVYQMLWYNRNNLRTSLRRLIESLEKAQKSLDDDDEDEFRKLFIL